MRVDQAVTILSAGGILENCRVAGQLNLRSLSRTDDIRVPITIRNVQLDSICAPACQFHEVVLLDNVRVTGAANFWAGYFLAGLQASYSYFGAEVDFQCGGHNKGHDVDFKQCEFSGFVNFFDCWYEGPVSVHECTFSAGSNLLGNIGKPFQVRFDVPPGLEGNIGRLDLNG